MSQESWNSQKMRARADPSSTSKRVARGWIAIGAAIVVVTALSAVAVFIFDMPMQNSDAGRSATKAETASTFFVIGGCGSIFVVLGVLIRRSR